MSIEQPAERICAHGVCNCPADEDSDYCGFYCAEVGQTTNRVPDDSQQGVCDCGHATCVG